MPRIAISSLDDPRLAPYRNLRQRGADARAGRFIAEGRLVVERTLASRYPVESVVVAAGSHESLQVPCDIPVYVLPSRQMEQVLGFNFHRGALACGRRPPTMTFSQALAPGAAIRKLVVCAGVRDPTNLGGVLRNCAAFGVDLVMLGDCCADPLSRRVLRVSMGTALNLHLYHSPDLGRDLPAVRDRLGTHFIAAVSDGTAEPLATAARPRCLGLVFGNEAHGLSPVVQQLCHQRLAIPMRLGTDSLNVAVASGIFLYHFEQVSIGGEEPMEGYTDRSPP